MDTHGTLKAWLKDHSPDERQHLADAVGSSVGYLYQLAGGHRQPSLQMALDIERHTGGCVSPGSFDKRGQDSADTPSA